MGIATVQEKPESWLLKIKLKTFSQYQMSIIFYPISQSNCNKWISKLAN